MQLVKAALIVTIMFATLSNAKASTTGFSRTLLARSSSPFTTFAFSSSFPSSSFSIQKRSNHAPNHAPNHVVSFHTTSTMKPQSTSQSLQNNQFTRSFPQRSKRREFSFLQQSSFSSDSSSSYRDVNETLTNDSISSSFDYTGQTVQYALMESTKQFELHHVPESLLSVCHLLAQSLDLPWSNGFSTLLDLYDECHQNSNLHPASSSSHTNDNQSSSLGQRRLSQSEAQIFASMCERRKKQEPLQYILGQWDFYPDLIVKCRAPMLCPRPETEELVDIMIQEIQQSISIHGGGGEDDKQTNKVFRVLDVGCGTGAIGVAIAKYFQIKQSKNVNGDDIQVQVVGIDILQEAVDLSMENAHFNLDDANVDAGDSDNNLIYQAILTSASTFANYNNDSRSFTFDFDMVVSNPPYIPKQDMKTLSRDVVDYESEFALCGGDDGMDVIRDIVERLPEWTAATLRDSSSSNTKEAICWMEVDTSHPKIMEQWLAPGSNASIESGVEFVERRTDLSGRDRFVKLRVLKADS